MRKQIPQCTAAALFLNILLRIYTPLFRELGGASWENNPKRLRQSAGDREERGGGGESKTSSSRSLIPGWLMATVVASSHPRNSRCGPILFRVALLTWTVADVREDKVFRNG